MAKKHPQVTCYCKSYPFPHRIGGGSCTGSDWARSFFEASTYTCQTCNCFNKGESGAGGERSGTCDVVEGLEVIGKCEGYAEHLEQQPPIRLPMSVDDFCEWLIEGYCHEG